MRTGNEPFAQVHKSLLLRVGNQALFTAYTKGWHKMDKNIINKASMGTFAASPLNFMLQVWHSNLSGIDDISAYNDRHGFYQSSSAVNRRFEIDLKTWTKNTRMEDKHVTTFIINYRTVSKQTLTMAKTCSMSVNNLLLIRKEPQSQAAQSPNAFHHLNTSEGCRARVD